MVSLGWDTSLSFAGEKLTDEEVDTLLQGVEDNQGQVNYEGWLFYLMLPGNYTVYRYRFCENGAVRFRDTQYLYY